MSRSSSGIGRPEAQAPPEVYYDRHESSKYSSNSRVQTIQAAMAQRCLELLNFDASAGPQLVLDVGCGSGLSGDVLSENGHSWVGLDISQHMLDVARARGSLGPVSSTKKKLKTRHAMEDEEEEEEEEEGYSRPSGGDALRCDMGQGFGFRAGLFDGAVSVSALQWLCYSDRKDHKASRRLDTFFTSLYRVLHRGARAALQLYPESEAQLNLITSSALRCGFTGGLVVDFPNSTKAKKYYLCLFAGVNSASLPQLPQGLGSGDHRVGGRGGSNSGTTDESTFMEDDDDDEGEEEEEEEELSRASTVRFGDKRMKNKAKNLTLGISRSTAITSSSSRSSVVFTGAGSSSSFSNLGSGEGPQQQQQLTLGQASHIAFEHRRAQKAKVKGRRRGEAREKVKGTRKWVLEKKAHQRKKEGGGNKTFIKPDTKYTGRKRKPKF